LKTVSPLRNSLEDILNKKPPIKHWWLLLLAITVFIPHLYYSYYLMLDNQTHDLHMRIIGSRLMEAGKNPYSYYWQPGDSIFLYDSNQSVLSDANGVTSTPFVLWLQKPLLQLGYCNIRLVWWMVQELLLFLTMWLALCIPSNRKKQLLTLIVTCIFFLYSPIAWLNIVTGQLYTFYAFVFMLSSYLLLNQKRNMAGFLYPIISLVRPFFIVSLIPLLDFSKKKIIAVVAGCAIALLLFFIPNKTTWLQYNDAMKVYATENTNGFTELRNKEGNLGNYPAEDCVKREKKTDGSKTGCLYSIQSYLYKVGITCNDTKVFSIALLIVVLGIMFMINKLQLARMEEQKMVLSIMLYFLCELFAPAVRNPYNLIQWFAVAVLLLNYANTKIILLFIIGLCLNHNLPINFKYGKELGEMLMLAASWWFVLKPKDSISRYRNSVQQQSSPI
jgi:hypothetical protein